MLSLPRYEGTTERTVRAKRREIQRPPPSSRRKEAGTSPAPGRRSGVRAAAAVAGVASQELRVHRPFAIDASQVKSLGGVRYGSDVYHHHGRALDCMSSTSRSWVSAKCIEPMLRRWAGTRSSTIGTFGRRKEFEGPVFHVRRSPTVHHLHCVTCRSAAIAAPRNAFKMFWGV